jgi:RNA polymerase sigma factor (sigma-70 family)
MKEPVAEEEFAKFFLQNFPKLTRAQASIIDPHLAEDVAQETMLVIRATWGRYDRPDLAMYKIARRMAYRVVQRHREVVPIPSQPLDVSISQQHEHVPFAAEHNKGTEYGLDIDVRHALMKLPQRQREVIVLSVVCDLATEDVAEVLGITESAVKTHKSRGLKRLEQLLGDRLVSASPQADKRIGGVWSD